MNQPQHLTENSISFCVPCPLRRLPTLYNKLLLCRYILTNDASEGPVLEDVVAKGGGHAYYEEQQVRDGQVQKVEVRHSLGDAIFYYHPETGHIPEYPQQEQNIQVDGHDQ